MGLLNPPSSNNKWRWFLGWNCVLLNNWHLVIIFWKKYLCCMIGKRYITLSKNSVREESTHGWVKYVTFLITSTLWHQLVTNLAMHSKLWIHWSGQGVSK